MSPGRKNKIRGPDTRTNNSRYLEHGLRYPIPMSAPTRSLSVRCVYALRKNAAFLPLIILQSIYHARVARVVKVQQFDPVSARNAG